MAKTIKKTKNLSKAISQKSLSDLAQIWELHLVNCYLCGRPIINSNTTTAYTAWQSVNGLDFDMNLEGS